MALTKVTGQVIKNTTDVTVGVLTVTNTLAVGGTVSVGGTLTYEDVTNIDSVGLITARNGIVVGSGITLSKDGDVFFTGIATGNGSGLTAINASNIGSGTVPTARLGSGTASSSTFLRGDSSFQTVNTDLVSDTSPQLGGNLDSNGNNIAMADNDQIQIGSGTNGDLRLYHESNISTIVDTYGDLRIMGNTIRLQRQAGGENFLYMTEGGKVSINYDGSTKFETTNTGATVTGNLVFGDDGEVRLGDSGDLQLFHHSSSGESRIYNSNAAGINIITDLINIKNNANNETLFKATNGGAVELYHNNNKKLETYTQGIALSGNCTFPDGSKSIYGAGTDMEIYHIADNTNVIRGSGPLTIQSDDTTTGVQISTYSGGETMARFIKNGSVELYHNSLRKFRTVSDGVEVNAAEGADAVLALIADEGDDNADYWRFLGGTAGQLDIANYATGSWVNHMTINGSGYVLMPTQCSCAVRMSANTSWPGNHAFTTDTGRLEFDTEVWDIGGNFDTSNYTFTAPVAGRYQMNYVIQFESYTGFQWVYMYPVVNDSISDTTSRGIVFADFGPGDTNGGNATYWAFSHSLVAKLQANDVVKFKVRGGVTSATIKGSTESQWNIDLLG